MALTVEQRIQLARALLLDLSIRRITEPADRERELARLCVLPSTQQNTEFRAAVVRVRAAIEDQQAQASTQRAAQDAAWTAELAMIDALDTGL